MLMTRLNKNFFYSFPHHFPASLLHDKLLHFHAWPKLQGTWRGTRTRPSTAPRSSTSRCCTRSHTQRKLHLRLSAARVSLHTSTWVYDTSTFKLCHYCVCDNYVTLYSRGESLLHCNLNIKFSEESSITKSGNIIHFPSLFFFFFTVLHLVPFDNIVTFGSLLNRIRHEC